MTQSLDATWTASDGDNGRATGPIVIAVLVVWFLLVLAAGATKTFLAAPSQPPLPLLIAVAGPPILFGLVYRASRRFQAFVLAIDLRFLTSLQSWRVLGGMFLVLYAYGLLPGLFAFPAGLGDLAVGAAAPLVLMAIITNAPNWRRQVLWLNVGGLLDFVGAIGTGVLTSDTSLGFFAGTAARVSLGELPLSLIPTFAVPLWIILHIIALLQLRRSAVGGHVDA